MIDRNRNLRATRRALGAAVVLTWALASSALAAGVLPSNPSVTIDMSAVSAAPLSGPGATSGAGYRGGLKAPSDRHLPSRLLIDDLRQLAPAAPKAAAPQLRAQPNIAPRAPKPAPVIAMPAPPQAPKLPPLPAAVPQQPAPAPVPVPVVNAAPAPVPPAIPKPAMAAKPAAPDAAPKPAAPSVAGKTIAIPFAAESGKLPAAAQSDLTRIADVLIGEEETRLQLQAYAAGDGMSPSQARHLSLRRALSVRSFLIEKGIRATRIDVRVLGDKVPDGDPNRVDASIIR